MPQVGRKHFAYTPAGRKAAQQYAKQTGQPVIDTQAKPKTKKRATRKK